MGSKANPNACEVVHSRTSGCHSRHVYECGALEALQCTTGTTTLRGPA